MSINYFILLEPVDIFPENHVSNGSQNINIFQILIWIYISGIIFNILKLAFQLTQLVILAGKSGIQRKYGVKVVYTGKSYTNFSFFNIIFLNSLEKDTTQLTKIITHEKIHIQQKHFIDLIIMELMTTFFWFNPFIWFYKRSIKTVHEYLADEGVLKKGYKKTEYQKLLFNQTFGMQYFALTNNFNQSLIKSRLTMMSKTKTNKLAILKVIAVLPLILLLIFACARNSENNTENKTEVSKEQQYTKQEAVEEAFTVVEQMPKYSGGKEAMFKFIAENTNYPEEARKQGVSGKVLVSFVVEKDGSITNIDVLRGIGSGCNEEAKRVVSIMPNWEPGYQRGKAVRVKFNLPFNFKLDGNKENKEEEKNKIKDPPPPPPPTK